VSAGPILQELEGKYSVRIKEIKKSEKEGDMRGRGRRGTRGR